MYQRRLLHLNFAASIIFGGSLALLPNVNAEETTGVVSDSLPLLPELAPGNARIFFYRKARVIGAIGVAPVTLDGVRSAWVTEGTAVYVDHAPGNVVVQIADVGFGMTLEPHKRYFVSIAAKAGYAGVVSEAFNRDIPRQHCSGGLLSGLGFNGGWCAGEMDETIGMSEMKDLSVSGPNPNAD